MMTSPSTQPAVRLERVIPPPPEQVYRAWLDPQLVRRWLAPGPMRVTRVEVDERVGGHLRVWQGSDDGDAGGFDCEILTLDPDRCIAFRWGFVGPDRADGPVFDSLLTVTLAEGPGRTTTLTLVDEMLDGLHEAMPEVADRVGAGWVLVLDELAATVGDGPVS